MDLPQGDVEGKSGSVVVYLPNDLPQLAAFMEAVRLVNEVSAKALGYEVSAKVLGNTK